MSTKSENQKPKKQSSPQKPSKGVLVSPKIIVDVPPRPKKPKKK